MDIYMLSIVLMVFALVILASLFRRALGIPSTWDNLKTTWDNLKTMFGTGFQDYNQQPDLLTNFITTHPAVDNINIKPYDSIPDEKCLTCEQVYNKPILIKSGLGYLAEKPDGTVVAIQKPAEYTGDIGNFYNMAKWQLNAGLSGDDNTVSFLNMNSQNYIIRSPVDNALHMANISSGNGYDESNNLYKQAGTFKLIDGVLNRNLTSIMPISIGNEINMRLVTGNGNITEYNLNNYDTYKNATFELLEHINEYPVITNKNTVNGTHVCSREHLQDTANRGHNKSASKRDLALYRLHNELTDAELPVMELFEDAGRGLFDEHTGAEFEAIMNKKYRVTGDNIMDKIFNKLEDAKINPDVKNLLDLNDVSYQIYSGENKQLESQINNAISENTETTNDLIDDMNKYRVKNMARDYFFLSDKMLKLNKSNLE